MTCWNWKLKFQLPELCQTYEALLVLVRCDSPSVAHCLGVVTVQAVFSEHLETSGSLFRHHIGILENSTSQASLHLRLGMNMKLAIENI